MTRHDANKIKKVLRAENAVFTSTAGYYDGEELRVKVIEFLNKSYLSSSVKCDSYEQRERLTNANIIKVLRALEKNGLRPPYRIEQRETSNALGMYDCRYLVFK